MGFAEDQVLTDSSSSGGLGLVQGDSLVNRNVVSGTIDSTKETSAAWSDMSGTSICAKTANGVVISWNDQPPTGTVRAGWAQACLGTGWVAQTATLANWGMINGKDGLPATGYGGDGTVISIPGAAYAGVFVYTTFLKKSNLDTATDLVLATSIDGGQTFHPQPQSVFNDNSGTVDRPIVVADPGANDGTIYLAWAEGAGNNTVLFRKAQVSTSGAVTLFPSSPAVTTLGHFMLAVKHGSPNNTVFLAFSTFSQHMFCGPVMDVSWDFGFTTNDGGLWQHLQTVDTDHSAPFCVQPPGRTRAT